MAIVVLVVGALLTIMGIAGYIYGLDAMPTERGVAGVISASVMFAGGIVTLAIGLTLQKLEELSGWLGVPKLDIKRPGAKTDLADTNTPDAPGPDLPKVVPLDAAQDAGKTVAVDIPKVKLDPNKLGAPKQLATKATDPAAPPVLDRQEFVRPEPVRPLSERKEPDFSPMTVAGRPSVAVAGAVAAGAAAVATTAASASQAGQDAVEKALAFDLEPVKPKEAVGDRLDALTAQLKLPPELPKVKPLELPKIDLRPRIDKSAPVNIDAPGMDKKIDAAIVDTDSGAQPPVKDENRLDKPVPAKEPSDEAELTIRDREVEYPVEVLKATPATADDADVPMPNDQNKSAIDSMEAELGAMFPGAGHGIAREQASGGASATVKDVEPPVAQQPVTPAAPDALKKTEAAEIEAPAKPPVGPAPGAEVVGAYESGGAKYTMYSDGSVIAEAAGETLYFKSLEELRDFIDATPKA